MNNIKKAKKPSTTLVGSGSKQVVRNSFKVRVLYYLSQLMQEIDKCGESVAWETAADISRNAGVNYKSAYVLLPRWREASWGYVDGMHVKGELCEDGRPHWFYRINARGLSWLTRCRKWYVGYDQAIKMVEARLNSDEWAPTLEMRRVGWHIYGHSGNQCMYAGPDTLVYNHTVVLEWPFKDKTDAHVYYYPAETDKRMFVVPDIKYALAIIRKRYEVEPARECLDRAVKLQESLLVGAVEYSAKHKDGKNIKDIDNCL